MHEMSLLADLMKKIETIVRENKADKAVKVNVRLGALSQISAGHFREHFNHAVPGTVAEGAELDVVELENAKDPQAQDIIWDSVEIE